MMLQYNRKVYLTGNSTGKSITQKQKEGKRVTKNSQIYQCRNHQYITVCAQTDNWPANGNSKVEDRQSLCSHWLWKHVGNDRRCNCRV